MECLKKVVKEFKSAAYCIGDIYCYRDDNEEALKWFNIAVQATDSELANGVGAGVAVEIRKQAKRRVSDIKNE